MRALPKKRKNINGKKDISSADGVCPAVRASGWPSAISSGPFHVDIRSDVFVARLFLSARSQTVQRHRSRPDPVTFDDDAGRRKFVYHIISMLKLNWNLDGDVILIRNNRFVWFGRFSCVLISIGINCAFGMLPSLSIKEFFHLHSSSSCSILKFSHGGWLDGWL